MTLHVKDGGTWKEPSGLHVKDGGTWKDVTNAYVKDGGSWKEFYNSATSYDYTINAATISTGGVTSVTELSLNSSGATNEVWTVTSVGSSPAGFYQTHTVGAVEDGLGTVTLTTTSKPASAGTRILLNFNVSCAIDPPDTVEPKYVQITHQF